ncbi:MAG: HD domain-containing protein, partial [Ignavibacteria bacterium]|nr:HD domain-containing protein [Ignavibacteria bacterium]
ICGSRPLFLKFIERINSILHSEFQDKLIQNILSDIEKRHLIYGASPLLIEPNIKSTAGGMRDMQSVIWLNQVLEGSIYLTDKQKNLLECFFESIRRNIVYLPFEIEKISKAYDYKLKLRNEIHYLSKSKNDKLSFQDQLNLASSLGDIKLQAHENQNMLMKEYFEGSEIIHSLLQFFIRKALVKIFPIEQYSNFQLDSNFSIKGRILSRKKAKKISLAEIILAFLYRNKYSALFSEELEKEIINSILFLDGTEIQSAEVSANFREILKHPDNLSETLIAMNRLGVLSIIIPEFEGVRRFFQPNAYHIYTTDEHTLIAIQNLNKLSLEDSLLGDIYRRYDNKEILFLAVLCHDIAKPLTLFGHEIVGAQIVESIMQRLGYDDEEIEFASFLVRNHLLMEQTAFRRNINDSLTLNNFKNNFSSLKELDFLYLLTYADLSAVNPSSWTSWKNSLLDELYRKSSEMIKDNLTAEELLTRSFQSVDFSKLEIPKDEFQNHIDLISDDKYLFTFTEREIALHIQEIKDGKDVSIITRQDSNFTNLTVIAKDKPALLSKICGAIAISDCNIHEASIFTRKDKIAIDNFNITDFSSNLPLSNNQIELLKENITLELLGAIDLELAFQEHKEKWKRIEKKFQKFATLEIKFEEHPIYTIIDIHTSDRIGLLYMITKKLTELQLNIYFAKIGTKLNGIFDSFYVLDKNFQKILPSKYEYYRDSLAESLTEMLRV